ncbi:hypothetical protein [Aquibacillus kalidii]|nr:hypothetical protein [Aquibacillus kalidii]
MSINKVTDYHYYALIGDLDTYKKNLNELIDYFHFTKKYSYL